MKTHRSLLIAGSSGLIGRLTLPPLLDDAAHRDGIVIAPTRRAIELKHAQLRGVVGELGSVENDAAIRAAVADAEHALDVFVCALGTTIKAAGSEEAFAAVDRDLVLHLASLALHLGARQAIIVSSVGADASSSNFYLRTKGRMERDVCGLGFARCDFMHPGLLLGERDGAPRGGEALAQSLAPWFNPLLAGPFRRYRAIPAETVAAAMVALVGQAATGEFRHDFEAMQSLAQETP